MDAATIVAGAAAGVIARIVFDWLKPGKPDANGHDARLAACEKEIDRLRVRGHTLAGEVGKHELRLDYLERRKE